MNIYINEHGAKIRLFNNHLLVEKSGTCINSIPIELVDNLLVNSSVQITSETLIALSQKQAGVSWVNSTDKIVCSLLNENSACVTRRKNQYALSDNKRLKNTIARRIIAAKIHNQYCLLIKMNAKPQYPVIEKTIRILKTAEKNCAGANVPALRGIEGAASRCYFSALALFINDKFSFSGRNRQPPKDCTNAALSYSYTLLYNYIDTVLRMKGFDTFEGIIHTSGGGHRALASDIMEIFRPYVSDCATISFLDKADTEKDFTHAEAAIYLSNQGRRKMIEAFEERLAFKVNTLEGYKNDINGLILSQVDRFSLAVEVKKASVFQPFKDVCGD